MWKKFVLALAVVLFIVAGLYWAKYRLGETPAPQPEPSVGTEEIIFSYNVDQLKPECTADSAMLCAIDKAIKCTLNPDFDDCRQAKLPKFIFMEDEALGRPTEMSFQVVKLKPISTDLVEVHTQSQCNGNWFGLCQGYVIYVLVPNGEQWRVKDIYAMEK